MTDMAIRERSFLVPFMILVLLLAVQEVCLSRADTLSRNDFPDDFIFGAGTSAYQWEGAAAEDGRSPGVWDTFTHAGGMFDKSTGDVASDGYHKYKEDVKLIADTGMDSYKFSISWSRLLPNGTGAVNPKGLAFYNDLINELVKHGIQPHVTLYHIDYPQVLEDEYGGWLNKRIVDDFTAYADVCFREFGDRVKQWTTMAEPNIIGIAAYDGGDFPPNRCSPPFGNCTAGNSATEPYVAVHNLLLSHASAAKLYKTKYQATQNGGIGMNIYSMWPYPISNSIANVKASQRTLDFIVGWILHPLVHGDYPENMKKIVRRRLPSFSKEQSELVKGSYDFFSLNHYVSLYVEDLSNVSDTQPLDYNGDIRVSFSGYHQAKLGDLGNKKQRLLDHLKLKFIPIPSNDPAGMLHMLMYIKKSYGNPPIFIEENGLGHGMTNVFNDTERINFLSGFIRGTLDALRNGSNLKGYYVWSLMDVFEYLFGYNFQFGLYYVDFQDKHRARRPKLSAAWYTKFLRKDKVGINLQVDNNLNEKSHARQ